VLKSSPWKNETKGLQTKVCAPDQAELCRHEGKSEISDKQMKNMKKDTSIERNTGNNTFPEGATVLF